MLAVIYGVLVPELWRLGLASAGLALLAGLAGPQVLLRFLLLTTGVTLAFVTSNQRALAGDIGGFNLDGLRLLAVLAAFGIAAIKTPSLLKVRREIWPLLLLLAWGAVTLLWSPSRTDGIRLLFKLMYPIVGFAAAFWLARREPVDGLWKYFAIGAVLASFANLALALSTGVWSEVGFEGRYRGGVGYNLVGHFSAMLGLVMLGAWLATKRVAYLWLGTVMFIQLVATGSRTAFVAFGVGVAVLGIALGKWKATLAAVIVALTVWVAVPTLGLRTVLFTDRQSSVVAPEWISGFNLSGRALIWYDVWNALVKEHILTGAGFGAAAPFLASRFELIRHVHNEYLHLLADGGAIALCLFLGAYALPVSRLLRMIAGSRRGQIYASIALSTTCCFLAASLAENTLEYFAPYHFFPWCMVGIALGFSEWEVRHGDLYSAGERTRAEA